MAAAQARHAEAAGHEPRASPTAAGCGSRRCYPPGHCRTPFYTRGRRRHGAGRGRPPAQPRGAGLWPRRACRACRSTASASPQAELWPDDAGAAGDAVVVDLFEPWLEPAEGSAAVTDHDHDHPHRPGPRGCAAHLAHGADRGRGRPAAGQGRLHRRRAAPGAGDRSTAAARPTAPGWSPGPGSIPASARGCSQDVNAAAAELGIDAGGIPIRAVANEPRRPQRHRLHAVLLLPAPAAGPVAGLVQVARLPQPRGARAARGAGASSAWSCRPRSRSWSTTARPSCATWSCPSARPAPRAGARTSSPPSSPATA